MPPLSSFQFAALPTSAIDGALPSIANAPVASSSATGSSPLSVQRVKASEKREPVPLRDLTGEEREVAVRMMNLKAYVGRWMRKQARAWEPYPQAGCDPKDGTGYQTAGELYSALRAQVLSGKKGFDWKGFHVIVAADDVDHKQRLEVVARELHKTGCRRRAPHPSHPLTGSAPLRSSILLTPTLRYAYAKGVDDLPTLDESIQVPLGNASAIDVMSLIVALDHVSSVVVPRRLGASNGITTREYDR
ncbi:hypothetical protein DFP72DRAFT_1133676 [Ephemerocybe angulata]|uniref:Uncharacterized protein n=1 Tax=Ephemerocybe angulata TaxID=980116 RepID=A0A8H6HSP8_9AGAR|nr:hypothetical protein DFP72DRAFT_1133676 [Tulosesus angulatus]